MYNVWLHNKSYIQTRKGEVKQMVSRRKIRVERRSYSYTIGIPMWIVKVLCLKTGDEFEVTIENGSINYKKVK